MKSTPATTSAPGRPPEIEEIANRLWVHPTSKALVNRLVRTAITPNQISVASVFAAGAASLCFVALTSPWGPITGLGGLFVWHVLDGADGDLARRTGRASLRGELIDGVCDHTSQTLVYISLGVILERSLNLWAWPIVLIAGLSHAIQANAYEAGRKTYRHWVYGAVWMRQGLDRSRSISGVANRAYLSVAAWFSPNEHLVETAMERQLSQSAEAAAKARELYKTFELTGVKRSGMLGSTGRSLVLITSLLAGSPLWFFLYETFVLNVVLAVFVAWRARANLRVSEALSSLGAEL